ncbi:MAG: TetR/AcrR family transcriptional regulator, partial [Ornithinibacter sp.]
MRPAVAPSARVPQQDRSRATRQRLLEAAGTCLSRDGWSAATVALIAQEAGISRGAAQHHFPTREALVTAALEHMFEQRKAALAATEIPDGDRAETVVRLLIDYYTDDRFRGALHVWTAAATDETMRAQIAPLERKFARDAHALAVRLLQADDSDPLTRTLIQATLDLARGLGLANV